MKKKLTDKPATENTPKLLVVDNRPQDIATIKNILKNLEIIFYEANSGEDALSLVKQHNFFLILMNIQMPVMDGIETAGLIRQNNSSKLTPIIFVSTVDSHNEVIDAVYSMGAVDYIIKPVNEKILISKVTIFLNIALQHILLEQEIKERIKAEKIKNDFVAIVSHELRTPLTAIQGSIGLIAGGIIGKLNQDGQNMLQVALSNCNRLLELVNDLLDMQKIAQGEFELDCQASKITPLIWQSINENKAYSDMYKVNYIFVEPNINPTVFIDNQRIMQVMTNLLSNAAKFNPENEDVHITIEMLEASIVRVSVIDVGSGIPDDFKPRIFEKFSQAESGSNRTKSGTGLGLSISKNIIENHQGKIGFKSNQERGTTFYFDLPLYTKKVDKPH